MTAKRSAAPKRIFDDMTSVSLVLHGLLQLLEMALNQNLTLENFHEARESLEEHLSAQSHPAARSIIASFAKSFFVEMEVWLTRQDNRETMNRFTKVLTGEETFSLEETLETHDMAVTDAAPLWYKQTLEIGKTLLADGSLGNNPGEKISALLRGIPFDTLLAWVAYEFFAAFLQKPPNLEKANFWWNYLSGQQPIHYKLNIRGLYVYPEFL